MILTLDLSDNVATQLEAHKDQLDRIIEIGLREVNASAHSGFTGVAEVLETLATLPTPEEVLALHPAPALEKRIHQLLEKNRTEGLSADEEQEWSHYEYLEHLIRMAKTKAKARLRET